MKRILYALTIFSPICAMQENFPEHPDFNATKQMYAGALQKYVYHYADQLDEKYGTQAMEVACESLKAYDDRFLNKVWNKLSRPIARVTQDHQKMQKIFLIERAAFTFIARPGNEVRTSTDIVLSLFADKKLTIEFYESLDVRKFVSLSYDEWKVYEIKYDWQQSSKTFDQWSLEEAHNQFLPSHNHDVAN